MSDLRQKSLFFGSQHALEDQPVGGMIASKNGALELQGLQELRHLGKQFLPIERLPLRIGLAESVLSLGEADQQCGQKLWLGHVGQARRILCMLPGVQAAAESA